MHLKTSSGKWWPFCLGLNTLRPTQDYCHFTDGIFKCISLNEYVWISLKISQKFAPNVRINDIPSLVQKMACTDQAISHYLNQWWLIYWRIYASLLLSELINWFRLDDANVRQWVESLVFARSASCLCEPIEPLRKKLQWNMSITTTSKIKFITCDLFSNVFWWRLNEPILTC